MDDVPIVDVSYEDSIAVAITEIMKNSTTDAVEEEEEEGSEDDKEGSDNEEEEQEEGSDNEEEEEEEEEEGEEDADAPIVDLDKPVKRNLDTLIEHYLEVTDDSSDENTLITFLNKDIRDILYQNLEDYEENLASFKKDMEETNEKITKFTKKGLKDTDKPVVEQLNKRKEAQDKFYIYLKDLEEKISDIKKKSLYVKLVANFDDIILYLDNVHAKIENDRKLVESFRETQSAAASRKVSSGIRRSTGKVTEGISSVTTGIGRGVRSMFRLGGTKKKRKSKNTKSTRKSYH